MAAGWGVDFVEPDIVLTKDSIPIVLHDIHLENSTDVAAKFPFRKRKDGRYYVRDLLLKEIRALNVLERSQEQNPNEAAFPGRFPRTLNRTSFHVPTLEEYLEFVEGLRKSTGLRLGVYPEIKSSEFHNHEGQDIVKIVYDTLVRFGYEETPDLIYIQSFDPRDLQRLKTEMGTKIALMQLIGKNEWKESRADYTQMMTEEGLKQVATYAAGIAPSLDLLFSLDSTNKIVRADLLTSRAHAVGLKVHAYTHRQDPLPAHFKSNSELFEILKNQARIDGLFSDFADEVLIWEGRLSRRSRNK